MCITNQETKINFDQKVGRSTAGRRETLTLIQRGALLYNEIARKGKGTNKREKTVQSTTGQNGDNDRTWGVGSDIDKAHTDQQPTQRTREGGQMRLTKILTSTIQKGKFISASGQVGGAVICQSQTICSLYRPLDIDQTHKTTQFDIHFFVLRQNKLENSRLSLSLSLWVQARMTPPPSASSD